MPASSTRPCKVVGRRAGFRHAIRLGFALLCLFGGNRQAALAAGSSIAAVVAQSGTAQVRHSGLSKVSTLGVGGSLFAGDVVATGANGKLSILFLDGSQVRLGANSSIQITEPTAVKNKSSFFKVLAGEIWARLRPGRAARTQYANLIVRGTEVDLAVAPDGTTTLTVIEGEVEFFDDLGSVVVEASQQSVIRPGSAPTRPLTIANPGLTIEWTLDLNQTLLPREKFYATLDPDRAKNNAAVAEVRLAATDTPANQFALGDALFDARRYREALAHYRAGRGGASDAVLAVRLGYTLLELDQLDEATATFNETLAAAAAAPQAVAQAPRRSGGLGFQTVSYRPLTPDEIATDSMQMPNMQRGAAETGLCWVDLQRNNIEGATGLARRAAADAPDSSEAHLALALCLMRAPGHEAEAQTELETAAKAEPATVRYQAEAWLALLALARDDTNAAATAGALAVQMQPDSALANAALASVAFYRGNTEEAERWAKRAVRLNPDSVATLLALAQADLAGGDTEAAAAQAARATALDPASAQGFYLLGVADAAQRDYSHSIRELNTALKLEPDYLAATTALARVYVRIDKPAEADAVLAAAGATHPGSTMLLAAKGEVLYSQGKYNEALDQYKLAVKAHPDSAVTYNGYARLAIDANHLNEAIDAGQRAVELAPEVSEFHSTLGLAYTFSHLNDQANREFREALVLDPNNALALVQLGIANVQGDPRTTSRTEGLSFVQGFLLDPGVARDLLPGGMHGSVEGDISSQGYATQIVNRTEASNGSFNTYINGTYAADRGDQVNSATHAFTGRSDTTYTKGEATYYAHLENNYQDFQLPGTPQNIAPDDELQSRYSAGLLAGKKRLNSHLTVWTGLFDARQRQDIENPNDDNSFDVALPGGLASESPFSETQANTLDPEIRFDWQLRNTASRSASLTFGAARARTVIDNDSQLLIPKVGRHPAVPGEFDQSSAEPVRLYYLQFDGRINRRLSVTAQVRNQRTRDFLIDTGQFSIFDLSGTGKQITESTLPSAVINYKAGHKLLLRLLANDSKTDISSSLFAPIGTLLGSEAQAIPQGLPDPLIGDLKVAEFDAERYLGPGGLLKLFLFHSAGRNIDYDVSQYANASDFNNDSTLETNVLALNRIDRSGAGVRLEQRIGRSLFSSAALAVNRTRAWTSFFDVNTVSFVPAIFNGAQAPYEPQVVGTFGLNYVDPSGYKCGLTLNYNGPTFTDNDDITAVTRPKIGGRTTVNLLLARERTARTEIAVNVVNLFNQQQFVYDGIPLRGRRVTLEIVRRY